MDIEYFTKHYLRNRMITSHNDKVYTNYTCGCCVIENIISGEKETHLCDYHNKVYNEILEDERLTPVAEYKDYNYGY